MAAPGAGLLAAVALAAVHLLAGHVRGLESIPRSRWLSASGGVAVAYVFVHLLPELGEGQRVLADARPLGPWLQHEVYLVALAGFVLFYGLERLARGHAPRGAEGADPDVFRLHVAAFAAYNALIGYLLVHRAGALAPFAVAMGLHFVVNDYGLRQHFRARYRDYGRWVLSGAVVAGWGVGRAVAVDEAALHALFAFLAGGVVLNVVKEELPAERESRFPPFLAGAAGYAALLVSL